MLYLAGSSDKKDIENLKKKLCTCGLSIGDLINTAWASASTFRNSDKRGGANGARISLEPQKNWEVNEPKKLKIILAKLIDIQNKFNSAHSKKSFFS